MISIMKKLLNTSLVVILVVLSFMPSGRAQDLVVSDDYIVTGGLAVGLDGVNGEEFNFTTMKLKENNVQLLFEDTDSTLSYPSMDWLLRANETTNGGANHFAIDIDDYVIIDTIAVPNPTWINLGCDVDPSQPVCANYPPTYEAEVRDYHSPFTIDESAVDSAVVITADKMEVSTGVIFSNSNVGLQFVDGTARIYANRTHLCSEEPPLCKPDQEFTANADGPGVVSNASWFVHVTGGAQYLGTGTDCYVSVGVRVDT